MASHIVFVMTILLVSAPCFAQEDGAKKTLSDSGNLEKSETETGEAEKEESEKEEKSGVGRMTKVLPEDLLANPNFDAEKLVGNASGEIADEELIEQPNPLVMFVVDSSGSMGQNMTKKKTKIYILKKLLARYLTSQWTFKSSSGLRVFGSRREKDCTDNYLAIQPGESKLGHIEGVVKGLEPVGKTPLADSLQAAYDDIKSYKGPKRIILFTDGEETCGKDPCKVLKKIKTTDVNLQFFVVAFGLKDQTDTLVKLNCLGDLSMADSEEELENLLNKLNDELNPNKNLRVISPDPRATVFLYQADSKKEMYRKFEAQLGIEVPPGRYMAVVNLKPRFVFQEFVIPPKKKVTLKVAGDGTYKVDFIEGLLNVELRNKENKVIKKFKSDAPTSIPTGRWNFKIFRVPYYEKIVEDYLVVPNGNYEENIEDAGVVVVKDSKVRGLYVFDAKGGSKGNYLTNFPFVLPKGLYEIKVDVDCGFKEVIVDAKKEVQTLVCGAKK